MITQGPRVSIDTIDSETGNFLSINNGSHKDAAFVVVRWDGDEKDNPKLLAFADLLLCAEDLLDVTKALVDLCRVTGVSSKHILPHAEALISRLSN